MDDLPVDCVFVIFGFLSEYDIHLVGQSSKKYFIAVLARHDRLWKEKYEDFSQNIFRLAELNQKQRKEHDNLKSYFQKLKLLKVIYGISTGFIFSKEINCWVRQQKFHCLNNVKLQDKILCRDIKAVYVGDGAVGKTTLLIRFYQNKFVTRYCPTIMDNVVAKVRFNDRMVGINLWDTAQQEDHDTLRPLLYQETDVFLLCYDCCVPISLKNVKLKWYDEVLDYSPEAAIIVCANKIDLRTDKEFEKEIQKSEWKEKTTTREGLQYAKELRAEIFIETSAKTGYNCGYRHEKTEGKMIEKAMLFAYIMKESEKKKYKHVRVEVKEKDKGKCHIM